MLKLLLYQSTQELYDKVHDYHDASIPMGVIAPEPAIADIMRERLVSGSSEIQTLTISKHLSDQLLSLCDLEVTKKSQIYFNLLELWNKLGLKRDFRFFEESYTLLTDIRSITFDNEVIDDVLAFYDIDTQKAVKAMHVYLEASELVDEHKAYRLINEKLRHSTDPHFVDNQDFLFWGFEFLNGQQVDYLKALSRFHDIIVPVHASVYDSAIEWDWVKWLEGDHSETIRLSDLAPGESKTVYTYPKGYLSEALALYSQDQKTNIYLGTNNINLNILQMNPHADFFFKSKEEIFEEEKKRIWEDLFSLTDPILSTENFDSYISKMTLAAVKNQSFPTLKIFSELKRIHSTLVEEVENLEIDHFTLSYIFSILSLDLPRVNMFPIVEKSKGHVFKLREIIAASNECRNILCFDESFGPLKSSSSKFFVEVEKYLAPIGPLRRSDLELQMIKSQLLEVINFESTIVLLQSGLDEKDFALAEVLKDVDHETNSLDFNSLVREFPPLSEINITEKPLSASQMQKYIDCPKSYFYSHHMNHRENLQIESEMMATELGKLEHKLIGDICENDILDIDKYITAELDLYCMKSEKVMREDLKQKYFIEIRNAVTNGVDFVRGLSELKLDMCFEKGFKIEDTCELVGYIDLLATSNQGSVVIDFKRSISSIPSKAEVESMNSIQIWFYFYSLIKQGIVKPDQSLSIGYINLRNLEDSVVFCTDEHINTFEKLGIKKTYSVDKFFDGGVEEFSQKINSIHKSIYIDKSFEAKPRKKQVCQYCDLKMICPRGEL